MPIHQVAVIPWRRSPTGGIDVLLIRRYEGGEWGIPKGGIHDHGSDYYEAARVECLEEAGAEGLISETVHGSFRYSKQGRSCEVRVLAMEVTHLRERYRERRIRQRAWHNLDRAADLVAREPVRVILREFASRMPLPGEAGNIPSST